MEQGRCTDTKNLVEYLVSGSVVFVRMRNRDKSWTNHEEVLNGGSKLRQHVESGYLARYQIT